MKSKLLQAEAGALALMTSEETWNAMEAVHDPSELVELYLVAPITAHLAGSPLTYKNACEVGSFTLDHYLPGVDPLKLDSIMSPEL